MIVFWSIYVCQKIKSFEKVNFCKRILDIWNRIFYLSKRILELLSYLWKITWSWEKRKKSVYNRIHLSWRETHESKYIHQLFQYLFMLNLNSVNTRHESAIWYSCTIKNGMTKFWFASHLNHYLRAMTCRISRISYTQYDSFSFWSGTWNSTRILLHYAIDWSSLLRIQSNSLTPWGSSKLLIFGTRIVSSWNYTDIRY